jgi:branched-subunit amino acid permease
VDATSKADSDFEIEGRKWSPISGNGTSKENGPALIGFWFTAVGRSKVLLITYWTNKEDSEKHLKTLKKIFASVKALE